MDSDKNSSAAVILSLLGGIIIILGGLAMILMVSSHSWWMGMMDGHYGMMGILTLDATMMYILAIIGIACGLVVLVGAILLNSSPGKNQLWGAIILVFSVLSLVSMGGFFIGAILGIVGGVLALTWKST